jgi:ABC-type transport system involved in multi-copper enzyme maturation permease subunit
MIRLSSRQFRTQALVALGGLLVVAIVVLVTHSHLLHMFGESATNTPPGSYDHIVSFLERALGFVVLAVPALIGVFWGAPLVARELETGTFRVAWTQSVTRTRWLAVKLGLVGVASMIVAGLFSLMVTWWSRPADSASLNRFDANIFGQRGITPMGYALFAFTLGVIAGMLIRRIQPAMVTTLVAFIATRLAVTFWARPHLWPPAHTWSCPGSVDSFVMLHCTVPGVAARRP